MSVDYIRLFITQALLDTQRKAVRRCGVDPLNLWVGKFHLVMCVCVVF